MIKQVTPIEGGIAIVISESNRSLDGERIPEVRHAGSAE